MTTPTNQAAMTDEEAADLVRSFRNSPLLDHRSKWADAFAMAEAALRERGELLKQKDAELETYRTRYVTRTAYDAVKAVLKEAQEELARFKEVGSIVTHVGDGKTPFAPFNGPEWSNGTQPPPGTKLFATQQPDSKEQ